MCYALYTGTFLVLGDGRTDLLCVYPLTGDLYVSEATSQGMYNPGRMLKQDFCKVSHIPIPFVTFSISSNRNYFQNIVHIVMFRKSRQTTTAILRPDLVEAKRKGSLG